jgi:hypothetical protein
MMFKSLVYLLLTIPMSSSFANLGLSLFADLPSKLQKHILYNVVKIDKQILDFNLKPNSTWTVYAIKDDTNILERIPPDLELIPVQIFEDTEPVKAVFFNFFRVDSTYLSGNRLEIVTVVRDKKNGKKRFIIIDYYSDTISSDPEHCLKKANAKSMKFANTETNIGSYMEDKYLFYGQKDSTEKYTLTKEFAVECNINIYYGSKKAHLPNYLEFNHQDILHVHRFKKFDLINNLWKDTICEEPFIAFYFPNALHFKIQMDKLSND